MIPGAVDAWSQKVKRRSPGAGGVGSCLMATERHFCRMESSGDALHNKVNVLYTQSAKVVKSVLCVFHHHFDKRECSRSYSCTGSKEPFVGLEHQGSARGPCCRLGGGAGASRSLRVAPGVDCVQRPGRTWTKQRLPALHWTSSFWHLLVHSVSEKMSQQR